MHFKRRRRRAGRVVLFVLAAVLLAALGTGMWLLWPRAMRRDMPSAAAPQGTLRGLRLSWSYPTAAGGLSSGPARSTCSAHATSERSARHAAQSRA